MLITEATDMIQQCPDILLKFIPHLFIPLHLMPAFALAVEEEKLMGFVDGGFLPAFPHPFRCLCH